jgi:Zn-dependent protease with chaperone function
VSRLPATYYDGRTSQRQRAELSLGGQDDLLVSTDSGCISYPLGHVQPSPRLARLPRTLRLPDGGHLELADDPLLDRWFPRRSLIEALADRLERHWPSAAAAGLLLVVGLTLFFWQGLPRIADSVARQIPPAAERAIADEVMRLVDRTMLDASTLPDAVQARLQAAFADLTADLPRAADYRLEFRHGGKTLGANAFALPGGLVVVTDQLVQLMADDALVVAVLAHEAGHHEHRHGLRAALQNSAIVLLVGFVTGDVTGFGSLAVSIPVLLLENGYTRDFEREADAFAVDLLRHKGLQPTDFAAALRKLQSLSPFAQEEDGVTGYLATHPATAERIDAAERAAAAP